KMPHTLSVGTMSSPLAEMFRTQLDELLQGGLLDARRVDQAGVRQLMRIDVGEVGPLHTADEWLTQGETGEGLHPLGLNVGSEALPPHAASVDLLLRVGLGIGTGGRRIAQRHLQR